MAFKGKLYVLLGLLGIATFPHLPCHAQDIYAAKTAGGLAEIYKIDTSSNTETRLGVYDYQDLNSGVSLNGFVPSQNETMLIHSVDENKIYLFGHQKVNGTIDYSKNMFVEFDLSTNSFSNAEEAVGVASTEIQPMAAVGYAHASDVRSNASAISSNDTDISTNASAISSNDTDISTNASAISSNDTDISANASAISSNDTDISANASAIASNDTDISSNASSITTNASAISSNDDDISSLQSLVRPSGSEVQIGSDSDGVTISSSAVKVGGENMIRKESDGSVHIGKNSLVLKESGGRQQMWAKGANGDSIDIDIVNGSDLLINGKSVQGQIDSNAANISANAKNISNLGTGIAAATSLTAALSALPAASTDSPFSCGVGTGGYSDKFALGVGCAAKINQRLNANIAASHVFGGSVDYGEGSLDTVAARAGFIFKFGKIDDSPKVAARKAAELHDKVAKLEESNQALAATNQNLMKLLQAQSARLDNLEKIASGQLSLMGDRASSD